MPRDSHEPQDPEPSQDFHGASTEQVRSLIDEHALFVATDENGNIQDVNDLFCATSGYSKEELIGTNHSIVSSDRHSREFWETLWATIKSGKTWSGEIRNRRKNGDPYWAAATISPITDSDGTIAGFASLQTDITDQKIAEEKLLRTTMMFKETSRAAHVGGWEVDLVENQLFWSSITKEIHEVEPDYVPDIDSGINFYKEGINRNTIREAVEKAIATGDSFDLELQIVTAKGRELWIRAIGKSVFEYGKCIRLYGTLQDIDEQVRSRHKLEKQHAMYHSALNAATETGFIATDKDGLITLFNKGSEELLGYTSEEMVGKQTPALIHLPEEVGERAAELSEELGREIQGFETFVAIPLLKGSEQREWTYVRKDGSHVPVSLVVTPVRNDSGQPCGFLGIAQDISERKETEKALFENEQRFRGAFENSALGMAIVGLDGKWIKVNETICSIVGYPEKELLKKTFQDITHPDDLEEDLAFLKDTVAGKRSKYAVVKRYIHANGNIIWIDLHVALIRDAAGNPIHFVSIIEDITERRKLERELETVSERLSIATKAGGVGVWDWDVVNNDLKWDDQMFALYGVKSTDFSGAVEAWQNGLHPEDKERAEKDLNDAIEGTRDFNTFFRVILPSGKIRHVRALGSIDRDENGNTVRMLGTNWDVTELVEQREELKALADRAQQASEAKTQFLANISHEIRTPMNGIIGMTSLLLESEEIVGEQRRQTEVVKSSAEALLSLINDLLDFSKVQSGKLELETLDFSLRDTLDDFASILSFRATSKGLDFKCRALPSVPNALSGDPGRLRQVLINLAGNAIKFTQKGSITIEVDLAEENDKEALLRFSVKDTGIGIDKDSQEKLFEKFTQADSSTSRIYGGTGLGLAISKEIVALLQGEIGVNSEPGAGSEFWFTARFAKQVDSVSLDDKRKLVGKQRVLAISSDSETLSQVESYLQSWKVSTDTIDTGNSALELMYQAHNDGKPFDCVIIDGQLPKIEGKAFSQIIREDPTFSNTRLVLISRLGMSEDFEALRFDACCTRPIRQSNLFNCLYRSARPEESDPSKILSHLITKLKESSPRILLAEDNVVNQMVARGILERFGLRADIAANGAEAIHAISSLPYDVILMDVQMPEVDGIEATKAIRIREEAKGLARTPIIAMTAHARDEDRQQCLEAGMDDYVSKPVDPLLLAQALERSLKERDEKPSSQNSDSISQEESVEANTIYFDPDSLRRRLMDDEELVRQVLEASIVDLNTNFHEFINALQEECNGSALTKVHTIKGSAQNASFDNLAEIALEIETDLRSDRAADAQNKVSDLEASVRGTVDEAKQYLARPQS